MPNPSAPSEQPSIKLAAILLIALTVSPLSGVADEVEAGKYYEKALMAFRNNDSSSAIIELKNAIQQNQNYVAAHILLGEIYLKQKSLSEAEVQINLANQLGADKSLTIKPLAQLYLYQMKYQELLKEIDPLRFNRELQPILYAYRGHAHVQMSQLHEALNDYAMAAQIDPSLLEATVGKAQVLLLRGDIKTASLEADKAMQLAPQDPGTWYLKGSIAHAQFNLEDALKNYDKTLEIDPDYFNARSARAGLLVDLFQDERAKIDLHYLREKFPFDPKSAYLHSVVLSRNNQADEASQELEKAGELINSISPEFIIKQPQLLMLAGLINYSLNRFDTAYDLLNQYVKQYPEQLGAYRLLGSVLLAKNEPEKVVELLKPVLVRNPNDHRLMFLLGNAYMQVGKHDLANSVLEKATALNKGNDKIHTEIGLNRLMMGQDLLATQELEIALSNNPANIQAGIPLVAMYIAQGEAEKALHTAQALYDKAPKNPILINLLGTAQVAAKQYKPARQSFEKALSIDPDFITAQLNLSKLDVGENHTDAAKQRLQKVQQKFPDNIAVALELATVEQAAGRFDDANQWLSKARALDRKSLPTVLALIDLKLKTGKASEALSLAQAEEINFPHNMQLNEALVRGYLATNSKDNAVNVLRMMAQEARFNAKLLYKIASYQRDLGDHGEVIKTLKKAVLGDEKHLPSQIALVETELNYGSPAFALSRAQNLLKQYPDKAFAYQLLGDIALRERDYEKAAIQYQIAFDKDPDTSLVMKLYQALKQSQQDNKAYNALEQWLKKHPGDEIVMSAFAEEQLRAGRLAVAQKYYETLLEKHPNQAQFLNNLAFIYFNSGNKKALALAEQAQKLQPDLASANDTLGWILVNNDQAEQGLHYLRNAQSRASQDPEIRYHIAVALDRLQRQQEAKLELELALKTHQPFNGIEQAKALLEKLSR